MRWKQWTATLLVIVGILVAVDIATGTYAIGASFQFAWRVSLFGIAWITRSAVDILALVLRRRAWRLVTMITPIGWGYLGSVFLTEARLKRAITWLDRGRGLREFIRLWWHRLSTWKKFVFVALVITMQVILLPTISQYIILFPVGFMVPVIRGAARRLYSWITDMFLGKLYWNYCGAMHRRAIAWTRSLWLLKTCHGVMRLARLQYLTAWRLWMYDDKYRDQAGELWISFLEPIRLWRSGYLNKYVGRPLFAGKRLAHTSQSTALATT